MRKDLDIFNKDPTPSDICRVTQLAENQHENRANSSKGSPFCSEKGESLKLFAYMKERLQTLAETLASR